MCVLCRPSAPCWGGVCRTALWPMQCRPPCRDCAPPRWVGGCRVGGVVCAVCAAMPLAGCVPSLPCLMSAYVHAMQLLPTSTRWARCALCSHKALHMILPSRHVRHCAFAQVSTPADVIKTRIMTQDPLHPKYSGMMDCAAKTVRAEGMGALVGAQPVAEWHTWHLHGALHDGSLEGQRCLVVWYPANHGHCTSHTHAVQCRSVYRLQYKGFFPTWARLGPWQLCFWVSYERLRSAMGLGSF